MNSKKIRDALTAAVDKLRAWPILALALFMLFIAVTQSQISLAVTLYGLGKIAGGAYLGYWVDRLLFPYARPHEVPLADRDASMFRRAVIVAACIVAAALVP